MLRKLPATLSVSRSSNLESNISDTQLRYYGLSLLSWNQINIQVHVIFADAMSLEGDLRNELSSRVNGFEGLRDIARLRLIAATHTSGQEITPTGNIRITDGLHGPIMRAFDDVFSNLASLKKLRDRVAHAVIINAEPTIGGYVGAKGSRDHVLLSETALSALYERMKHALLELAALNKLVTWSRYLKANDPMTAAAFKTHAERESAVKEALDAVTHVTAQRSKLPKLPDFPS